MAGGSKIELFKFIRKTYQDIGFLSPQSNRNGSFFNTKNWLHLFCVTISFLSTTAYLLFEAAAMTEYGVAFFVATSILLAIIKYSIICWQMENVLSYIENCERFIEKSEYRSAGWLDKQFSERRVSSCSQFLIPLTEPYWFLRGPVRICLSFETNKNHIYCFDVQVDVVQLFSC